MISRKPLLSFLLYLIWMLVVPVHAQEESSSSESSQVQPLQRESAPTLDELNERREAIANAATIEEDQRQRLLETIDQTLSRFTQYQQIKTEYEQLQAILAQAEARIQALQDAITSPPDSAILSLAKDVSLEEIDAMISAREGLVAEARDSRRNAEADLSRLLASVNAISEAIATRTQNLVQIEKEMQALPNTQQDLAAQALDDNLKVRLLLNRTDLALKETQLQNQNTLTTLLQAERDASQKQIEKINSELEQLRELAQNRRERQAQQAVEQAERLSAAAQTLPPEISSLAEQNRSLRAELADLVNQDLTVKQELERAKNDLEAIQVDFERIQHRVDVVGRSDALAKVLHARRNALPSLGTYAQERRNLDERIQNAIERQLIIDEQSSTFASLEKSTKDSVDRASMTVSAAEKETLLQDSTKLLAAFRASLQDLQQGYAQYVISLTNLDIAARQRFDIAQDYVQYIEEQLLWMPNTKITALLNVQHLQSITWLVSYTTWLPLMRESIQFAQENAFGLVLFILLLLTLQQFNRSLPQRMQVINAALNRVKLDSTRYTFEAMLFLVLKSVYWPLIFYVLGRVMSGFIDPLAVALGKGFMNASFVLASTLFISQLLRPQGVGESHFRWSARICKAICSPFKRLTVILTLAVFCIAVLGSTESPDWVQTIGSLIFSSTMVGIFILIRRLFSEKGEMRACIENDYSNTKIQQFFFLWHPLLLALPIALALAALAGYTYTAMHFAERIMLTVAFILGIFILTSLILRWLYVTERRFRYEDAIRRRDLLRAQRANEDATTDDTGDTIAVESPEVNYQSLSEQSRRLVKTGYIFAIIIGTWSIWVDLIPALGFLQAAQLPFETTQLVEGETVVVPITLSDILVGFFMIFVTFLAAKNLPGVLELTLLQRLPLDAGARYAITSLSQYSIVGIGLIMAINTMGFQWSGMQWLIAALGVGLGFGLQEIVANFVSGIILLFERPIRVGDVVTIDNTTGVVSRIQIRATTITNYDKQELLVPNKDFITGRLINWTLSDKINRILLPVGLAYGEDVDKALQIILDVAHNIPDIIDDPAPIVSFESFGNDALMLYLRAFLANMDNRLGVITELHQQIYNRFNEAGLTIAFPQRDVHLDIKHPVDIRIQRNAKIAD